MKNQPKQKQQGENYQSFRLNSELGMEQTEYKCYGWSVYPVFSGIKLFTIHALNTTQVCDYTVKQDMLCRGRFTLSVTEQAEINRCEHRTARNADTVTL